MGNTAGEKPKFDLITASKTKKYKIITGVVLGVGILLLALSLLFRSMLTAAVTPNSLTFMDGTLSGLSGTGPTNFTCEISIDQNFVLSTGTPQGRALANPITFTLDQNARTFLEVREKTGSYAISRSNYQGMFYLHIREDAPEYINGLRPSGDLTIRCGSKVLKVTFTYVKV